MEWEILGGTSLQTYQKMGRCVYREKRKRDGVRWLAITALLPKGDVKVGEPEKPAQDGEVML